MTFPEHSPIKEFEPNGQTERLGRSYFVYTAADDTDLRLLLSENGHRVIEEKPELRNLVERTGQYIARHGPLRPNAPITETDSLRLEMLAGTSKRDEGSVYRTTDTIDPFIVKQHYDRGGNLQFYFMQHVHEVFENRESPSLFESLHAPAQYGMFIASSGQTTTIMEKAPGVTLDEYIKALKGHNLVAEDPAYIEEYTTQRTELVIELVKTLGLGSMLVLNDIYEANILVNAYPHPKYKVHNIEDVWLLDQPRTASKYSRTAASLGMRAMELSYWLHASTSVGQKLDK